MEEDKKKKKNNNSIRLVTWNIDQANIEEKYEKTKFDNRWPLILSYIKECNADIICLQELRNLDTSSVKVNDILYNISLLGYDYKHAYYGPDKTSFAQAIFYRREKFFITDIEIHFLPLEDETKPTKTKNILCVTFNHINTDIHREFVVCSTHFDFEESVKEKSSYFLRDLIKSDIPGDIPFLCAGDYNFFDDRDGIKHRDILLGKPYDIHDMIYPLSNASGTFMGYEHNQFKQPFDKMSRLDHVFSQLVFRYKDAFVFGDIELIKKREYPSDHLMIVLDFNFCD